MKRMRTCLDEVMGVGEVRIRTVLPEPLYRSLREKAETQGATLGDLLRDAVRSYLEESVSLADDSSLSFLGDDLSEVDWAQRKAWRVIQRDPMSAFLHVRRRKMVTTRRTSVVTKE